MKARVIATGALLEVRLQDIDTEYPYICDMQGGTLWKESELEFLDDDSDYWTRLEHQYAGMAMQGLMSREYLDDPDSLVSHAIHYAHTLVEKMKEEK